MFECWLHPARYRTQLCTDGESCTRRVCFFAHGEAQLRTPEDGARTPAPLSTTLELLNEALALQQRGATGAPAVSASVGLPGGLASALSAGAALGGSATGSMLSASLEAASAARGGLIRHQSLAAAQHVPMRPPSDGQSLWWGSQLDPLAPASGLAGAASQDAQLADVEAVIGSLTRSPGSPLAPLHRLRDAGVAPPDLGVAPLSSSWPLQPDALASRGVQGAPQVATPTGQSLPSAVAGSFDEQALAAALSALGLGGAAPTTATSASAAAAAAAVAAAASRGVPSPPWGLGGSPVSDSTRARAPLSVIAPSMPPPVSPGGGAPSPSSTTGSASGSMSPSGSQHEGQSAPRGPARRARGNRGGGASARRGERRTPRAAPPSGSLEAMLLAGLTRAHAAAPSSPSADQVDVATRAAGPAPRRAAAPQFVTQRDAAPRLGPSARNSSFESLMAELPRSASQVQLAPPSA